MTDYTEVVKAELDKIEPKIKEIRKIGGDIKVFPYKLNTEFYLEKQDDLSELYADILESYLKVKALTKEAEAEILLTIKEKYSGGKAPNAEEKRAEVTVAIKDVEMGLAILEAWYKIVKNYIQSVRAHVNAVNGRDSSYEEEPNKEE